MRWGTSQPWTFAKHIGKANKFRLDLALCVERAQIYVDNNWSAPPRDGTAMRRVYDDYMRELQRMKNALNAMKL